MSILEYAVAAVNGLSILGKEMLCSRGELFRNLTGLRTYQLRGVDSGIAGPESIGSAERIAKK